MFPPQHELVLQVLRVVVSVPVASVGCECLAYGAHIGAGRPYRRGSQAATTAMRSAVGPRWFFAIRSMTGTQTPSPKPESAWLSGTVTERGWG